MVERRQRQMCRGDGPLVKVDATAVGQSCDWHQLWPTAVASTLTDACGSSSSSREGPGGPLGALYTNVCMYGCMYGCMYVCMPPLHLSKLMQPQPLVKVDATGQS